MKKSWTTEEAAQHYETINGYPINALLRHTLGHLMATSAMHPDHLMDFEYARSIMPSNRIAGYEAECLAPIYEAALSGYPKPWEDSIKTLSYKDIDYKSIHNENDVAVAVFNLAQKTAQRIYDTDAMKMAIGLIKNDAGEDFKHLLKTDTSDQNILNHYKKRAAYTKNFEHIQWPSLAEIKFHMKHAEELCEKFAQTHEGKYPSEYSNKDLAKMPLADFAIDHQFPQWLKQEWQEQTEKWREHLKPKLSGDQTHLEISR